MKSSPFCAAECLRTILKKENISLKKGWGQNFLVDKNCAEKLIDNCSLNKNDLVLEIGPGLGVLTKNIALRCRHLTAVEIDRKLSSFLNEKFSSYKNVQIVCSDILKYSPQSTARSPQTKLKVIGNLPYYITSAIITYLIKNREAIEEAFITIQKEVADRLIAQPGSKDYGSLSCFVQFYCKVHKITNISKSVFYPRPLVESSFLSLKFLERPLVKIKDTEVFFRIIRAAFNQRRKTILNALSASKGLGCGKDKINKILFRVDIDPKRRGETLSLAEFAYIEREYGKDKDRSD